MIMKTVFTAGNVIVLNRPHEHMRVPGHYFQNQKNVSHCNRSR
jgi:hypothetical protein